MKFSSNCNLWVLLLYFFIGIMNKEMELEFQKIFIKQTVLIQIIYQYFYRKSLFHISINFKYLQWKIKPTSPIHFNHNFLKSKITNSWFTIGIIPHYASLNQKQSKLNLLKRTNIFALHIAENIAENHAGRIL